MTSVIDCNALCVFVLIKIKGIFEPSILIGKMIGFEAAILGSKLSSKVALLSYKLWLKLTETAIIPFSYSTDMINVVKSHLNFNNDSKYIFAKLEIMGEIRKKNTPKFAI